jgi:hypothetical protein
MHFWIDIEFIKILGRFKQKKFVDLFMKWNLKLVFNLLDLFFVNCNYFFEYIID